MTPSELRTARADAVVARGSHLRPHGIAIGEIGQFGQVSLRFVSPVAHLRKARAPLPIRPRADRKLLSELQSIQAEVIRTALQQSDAGCTTNCAREGRQIAMKQLILQLAGAGGNNDSPA